MRSAYHLHVVHHIVSPKQYHAPVTEFAAAAMSRSLPQHAKCSRHGLMIIFVSPTFFHVHSRAAFIMHCFSPMQFSCTAHQTIVTGILGITICSIRNMSDKKQNTQKQICTSSMAHWSYFSCSHQHVSPSHGLRYHQHHVSHSSGIRVAA